MPAARSVRRTSVRPAIDDEGFLPQTQRWLETASPARRKRLGQYPTPAPIRRALLEGLRLPPRARVLDPACGSGEFLRTARALWPDARLEGWEIDPALCALARRAVPSAVIRRCDALRQPFAPGFDAVIGNPPYGPLRAGTALRQRYAAAISGRANVYALFLLLGAELLRDGGVLAFVVPPSMNNGAYFRALREALLERCAIESLRLLPSVDLFEGAQQTVMLLRLRRSRRGNARHVFRRGPFALFAERPEELAALFAGATTLSEQGFDVRTGSVVWNASRERLADSPRGATRLLWSHNIGDGVLDLAPRAGRPRYVRGVRPLAGPALVVNRITGAGPRARLRVAEVPEGMEFVGENHVNVVLPPRGGSARAESASLAKLVEALRSERVLSAARLLTGNTQISRTELLHLIPLPRRAFARREPEGRT